MALVKWNPSHALQIVNLCFLAFFAISLSIQGSFFILTPDIDRFIGRFLIIVAILCWVYLFLAARFYFSHKQPNSFITRACWINIIPTILLTILLLLLNAMDSLNVVNLGDKDFGFMGFVAFVCGVFCSVISFLCFFIGVLLVKSKK